MRGTAFPSKAAAIGGGGSAGGGRTKAPFRGCAPPPPMGEARGKRPPGRRARAWT